MKNLLLVLPLAVFSLGLSSCCSMFGVSMPMYSTETVRACCRTSCKPAEAREGRIVKIHTSGSGFRQGQYRLDEAATRKKKTLTPTQASQESQPAYEAQAQEALAPAGYSSKGGIDSKGGMVQPVEQKPAKAVCYKKVKRIHYTGLCVRPFCPDKVCCGTTGPRTRQLATTQSATGAPNLGLIPTMKPLAP